MAVHIKQQKRIPQYRLYIDESGDHTDKEIDKPEKRYLSLTGCIIANEYYRTTFQPELEGLKQKYFPHSPDQPLILHRSEIINKKGRFWRLRDTEVESKFNEDLLIFFKTMQYVIITVVIDKKSHFERYGESAMHPYHYCLAALLERYCGFLRFHKMAGDALAESRGREEDVQLKNAYIHVHNSGTFYRSAAFFQEALSSKEIKIKPKIANIAGTQLADLLAHPSKQEILFDHKLIVKYEERFGDKIREVIQQKYNQRFINSQVEGYGKVFLA